MSFKIGYLFALLTLVFIKDAWCDPASLAAIGVMLSGAGASVAGAAGAAAPFVAAGAAGYGISQLVDGGNESAPTQSAYASTPADTGAVQGVESLDAQAARRRLARLSKYFTSPTGVLDTPTGSAGVF